MTLMDANVGEAYEVKDIDTRDPEMDAFLFRLGCYSGEPIAIVSKNRKGCVVVIKDSRYNFDKQISQSIIV